MQLSFSTDRGSTFSPERRATFLALLVGVVAGIAIASSVAIALFLAAGLGTVLFLALSRTTSARSLLTCFVLVLVDPIRLAAVLGLQRDYAYTLQKAMLLILIGALHVKFGSRFRGWPLAIGVFFAATASLDLIGLLGPVPPDPLVVIRAGLGFALPVFVLGVNWRAVDMRVVLRGIAWLPSLSLLIGLGLLATGSPGYVVWERSFPRLAGASIPAHLAMGSLIAMISALWLVGLKERRALLLACANLVICVLTLTRGAVAAAFLVIAAFVFIFRSQVDLESAGKVEMGKLPLGKFVLTALLLFLAAGAFSALLGRSEIGGVLNSSGRFAAWESFLSLARGRPAFGYHLGFSTGVRDLISAGRFSRSFVAPHNEYIHFLLDLGIVRFVVLGFLVAGLTLASVRSSPAGGHRFFLAVVCVMLLYAFVDNLFSTPAGAVLLSVLLSAVVGSAFRETGIVVEKALGPHVVRAKSY